MLRVRLCGGLEVEADGRTLPDALVGGRQGRLVLAYLVCERPRAVRREELAELLWADRLPDSWSASLSAVISRLRRLLTEAGLDGAEAIVSTAGTYQLVLPEDAVVDVDELAEAVDAAEAAATTGDAAAATAAAEAAEAIGARGFLRDDCDWVDRRRELLRDLRVRAGLARSAALLVAGSPGRAVEVAREALALDESREAAYRQLMRALAAAGERGEALRVWERCRTALVEELGVDPSPETEAVYLEVLAGAGGTDAPPPGPPSLPSGVVTFLLTDIVDSSALWDKAPGAMAIALERHDALVGDVVAAHGGALLKSKLEGDATVSVFARASDGAAAALALQDALAAEPWPEGAHLRLRMALHTGEAFERGGDYFGPALNRAARLRSLSGPGEVLLSQAVTEVVRDHLPPDAVLRDLGHRDLRGLSRGENVCALQRALAVDPDPGPPEDPQGGGVVRPALPGPLTSAAPFVGRDDELVSLVALWDGAVAGGAGAAFIGGEPGVGKSRLAGELAAHAHGAGAIVLYGHCDEDLAAPLQPFLEALRTLVPALGAGRVREVRGVDELTRVVPELAELLPDRAPAVRADPDTERLALFDAVASVMAAAAGEAPVLLVLDDLHWAGKSTLSLLRHLLREAKDDRLLVVGTYRDTELARTHPLAETLADLRRGGDATRISLGGLAAEEIEAYLGAVGIDDRALGRELAEVTSGNPFFLIEVLRHVEETGGTWSPGNLPEGVREATGHRLSRLTDATNRALSVAAVVGQRFDLAIVEQALGTDLVDEIAEACQAGLVVEEPGSVDRFRFAHALVRQVLLAELVTVKRVRLHRTIAELLERAPVGVDPDARLADLAYHWSECASLGDAGRAVEACRRAADRAMERLAYEEAGDLYGMALQVLDDGDEVGSDERADLHLARCDALLTAGDVAGARAAIDALEAAAAGSERLAAWYTTYEGLLAVLAEPDRLTEIVQSIGAAAGAMRAIGDLRGEARAHYVHAAALERLGQIGAAERALDAALAAARSADDRRLQDSILAEAPPAALWGPSSVTRASGRCLDVVRVLRINDGAPAVESVALRCQAVLEALRGRGDAARRMVGSARRTVERLGLAHRQLETEVAAGFVELLDGNAPEAERLLRAAYEGLRQRGLGGEAAQAAALLGRALLLQDRVDEADEVAAEAETLAGSDLKAAIAWRGVRAEAAARRGEAGPALALAREAVELAAATDALLLVADARLALAAVLRATGDHAAADDEARRALDACEAKGATALAARARADRGAPELAPGEGPADPHPVWRTPVGCPALEAAHLVAERFNRGAFDELESSPDYRAIDRRPLMADEFGSESPHYDANVAFVHAGGARFDAPELLVARERLALLRWPVHHSEADWTLLVVFGIDATGRTTDFVLFDPEQRSDANVELDRLTPDQLEDDTPAWRAARRFAAAANAHDWDAFAACVAPGYERVDRRTELLQRQYEDPLANHRTMFELDDWVVERNLVDVEGDRRVLVHDVVWFRDGAAGDAEVETYTFLEIDHAGLIVRHHAFDPQDLELARAELHRPGTPATTDTTATRAVRRLADAVNAHDWERVTAALAPEVDFSSRRGAVTVPDAVGLVPTYELLFSMDDWSVARTVLRTHGDRRVLVRDVVWFRTRQVDEAEVETLNVFGVDERGRVVSMVSFAADDLDGATAELTAMPAVPAPEPDAAMADMGAHRDTAGLVTRNAAWRAVQAIDAASDARDLEALRAVLHPDFRSLDRRSTVSVEGEGGAAYEILFGLSAWRLRHALLDTRGDDLVLTRTSVWFRDGDSGPAEVEVVTVFATAPDGRILLEVGFDPDDLAGARAELEARWQAAAARSLAWRAAERWTDAGTRKDLDAVQACFRDDVTHHDRRIALTADLGLRETLDWYRVAFALDEYRQAPRLLAVRGDRLALVENVTTFRDGVAGPSEIVVVNLFEVDDAGRISRLTSFERAALGDAIVELDARWRATQGGNLAWHAVERYNDATNAREWEALTACFRDDVHYDDRRSAVALELHGDDVLQGVFRAAFELDEYHVTERLLDARGEHVALVELRAIVRDGAAGTSEVGALNVVEVDGDGLVRALVAFDPDALAEATAELEARAAATAGFDADDLGDAVAALDERWAELQTDAAQPRPNRAWEVDTAALEAFDRRDWDGFIAHYDPAWVFDERRPGLAGRTVGAAATASLRIAFDLDAVWERRLVATAGDRLVLSAESFHGTDGAVAEFEVASLAVVEVSADDRVCGRTRFRVDQLEAARAELHERQRLLEDPLAIPRSPAVRAVQQPGWRLVAALGEHVCLHDTGDGTILHEVDDQGRVVAALSFGPHEARVAFDELVRRSYPTLGLPDTALRLTRAAIAGDLDAVAACLGDATIEDHRRLRSAAAQGAEQYVGALLQSVESVAPDHLLEIRRLEVPGPQPWGHLSVICRTGTTDDDAPFETPYVSVVCWDPSGRLTELALYEPEDIELARARLFAARPASSGHDDHTAIPRNLAARSVDQPGWTRMAAFLEHLCLHDTGDRLVLHEVEDDGQVTAFLAFDRADRRGAFDELTRRGFRRAGAPPLSSAISIAMNARDVAELRACMSDDCVIEDHRDLRVVPVSTADEYVAAFSVIEELAPDYTVELRWLLALEPWGSVSLTRLSGTTTDGAPFEITSVACTLFDEAGRARVIALYEPHEVDAALARLAAAAPD